MIKFVWLFWMLDGIVVGRCVWEMRKIKFLCRMGWFWWWWVCCVGMIRLIKLCCGLIWIVLLCEVIGVLLCWWGRWLLVGWLICCMFLVGGGVVGVWLCWGRISWVCGGGDGRGLCFWCLVWFFLGMLLRCFWSGRVCWGRLGRWIGIFGRSCFCFWKR